MTPNEIILEHVCCECGSNIDNPVLIGKDWINNLTGEFQIVRCTQCGLMRTNPRPTKETIGFYYPDSYAPYLTTQIKPNTKPKKIRKGIEKYIANPFQANSKSILPKNKAGHLLEIGCGSGDFLMAMQQQGWLVDGLEYSESATENAKQQGLNVQCSSLEAIQLPKNKYDMIVAWMVIEHLHHPVAGLEKLYQALNECGVLVISVPDTGGIDFKLFKEYYYALHLPNHLYHFTKPSLNQLILKAGFKKSRFFWQRNPNNLLSSLIRVLDNNQKTKAANLVRSILARNRLRWLSKLLGLILALIHQSGRMTVWAYK